MSDESGLPLAFVCSECGRTSAFADGETENVCECGKVKRFYSESDVPKGQCGSCGREYDISALIQAAEAIGEEAITSSYRCECGSVWDITVHGWPPATSGPLN